MNDEKKQPEANSGGKDELLGKIKVLEESLEKIEQSRKQKSMISLIGLVLVLLGIVLFFMNLKSFAEQKFTDEAFRNKLMETLRSDMKEIAEKNPNITLMQQDFQEKVLPYVSKQIINRFKEDVPKFQKEGENFASELEHYLNEEVKEKLVKALSESLVEVEGVLKQKYPKMTTEELQKILDKARSIFIIKITDVIEKKLEYISKDLGTLKGSIERFKSCEEYKAHDSKNPHTVHNVKIQMVESMLELVIYQLNEQKGGRPVEPLIGGAK